MTANVQTADRRAWKLTALYGAIAVAAFFAIRNLPLTAGSLHYTDFHAGGMGFLEFCEPGSPQFAPVDRVQSPVKLELKTQTAPLAGAPVAVRLKLMTSAGKPVAVEDLLVVHTEKLHVLLVDAALDDYHHVHPKPVGGPGEFEFTFTPQRSGLYRVFADFAPRATGRGLYAGAKLEVAPADGVTSGAPGPEERAWREIDVGAYRFTLEADEPILRINETTDLRLEVARKDGGPVELEEIMGARAHLVAFDRECTGFAHLHPKEAVAGAAGGGQRLEFTLLLSDPGYYRLWAQVQIEGNEVFAPFGFQVEP